MIRAPSSPSCATATLIGLLVGLLAAVVFSAIVLGPFLVFGPWGLLISAGAVAVLSIFLWVISRRRRRPKS